MKALIFVFAFLVSSVSFADVVLGVQPSKPLVMSSNATFGDVVIQGPWISAQIPVTNNNAEVITVVGFRVKLVASNGEGKLFTVDLSSSPVAIYPGMTAIFPNNYFDGLPGTTNFEYSGTISLLGWTGTELNPGQTLDVHFGFVTQ